MAEPLLDGRTAPLRVAVLVSATGANLTTLLELSRDRPDVLEVVLVASDRRGTPALDVARAAGVEAWPGDFERECGRFSECRTDADRARYRDLAEAFHDRLADRVEEFEHARGEIDLVVLAYHRWIHGRLLKKFDRRVVNQHPGDLASLRPDGTRALVGLDPVGDALRRGDRATRTSTFLVDASHDGGPVLAQGPEVPYEGGSHAEHELRQKTLSDRPALRFAVTALAEGRYGIDRRTHPDGSAVVLLDGQPLPLGGMKL
ncbi:formyltransferase family protein [Lentzea sp. NPDC006480]|uniref:phosphoribosylglycinamide formyltransferase n=1 Tax=Lentzea sp. NPDC006480 TaxID=3157176 RepID=UPI0033A1D651